LIDRSYNVGIAGYGIVGKRRHHFIDQTPHFKTVAVCDKTFDGVGTLDDGTRHYTHYLELLDNESIDVLFVCLTNDVASEVTISGLERGLHVFCEKPPGRDLDDIRRVLEAEKKAANLKLKYGFNHRYHDSVIEAKRIIDEGILGKVVGMRGVYGKSVMLSYSSDWRTKRAIAGGGILLDQGIHMLDLMRYMGGEFDEVKSFIANDFWHYDIEDNAYALLKAESGFIAMIHSTGTEWRHKFNLHITLEKAAVILEGILSSTKSYGSETLTIAYKDDDDSGMPREQQTKYIKDHSWLSEIQDFTDAIIHNRPITTGSSWDAYKSMELVYKIYCADPDWSAKYNITM
jgi:predicted dehydrogenase